MSTDGSPSSFVFRERSICLYTIEISWSRLRNFEIQAQQNMANEFLSVTTSMFSGNREYNYFQINLSKFNFFFRIASIITIISEYISYIGIVVAGNQTWRFSSDLKNKRSEIKCLNTTLCAWKRSIKTPCVIYLNASFFDGPDGSRCWSIEFCWLK